MISGITKSEKNLSKNVVLKPHFLYEIPKPAPNLDFFFASNEIVHF